MTKEQFEKLEAILKVLDKAEFNNLKVADQYNNVKILSDFATTLRSLKVIEESSKIEKVE